MNADKTDLVVKIKAGASDAHVSLNKDGIVQHKTVSLEDLVAQLTASQKLSTGVLPRNTRFFNGTPVKYRIGLETIARTRDFGVFSRTREEVGEGKKVLRIPFPPCLFVFDVTSGQISATKVFALKHLISKKTDHLYNFPFGNVYGEGRICWGQAKMLPIRAPMNLISMISVFFDSPFNGDLVNERTFRSPPGERIPDFWSLVNYLDGKEAFPDNLLYKSAVSLKTLMKE